MRRRNQRLLVIAVVGSLLAVATGLAFLGFRDSVVYFYAPAEIASRARVGEQVRLGGLVGAGSVTREGELTRFDVTDGGGGVVTVRYRGLLPDLFREGQGVVAEGVWRGAEGMEASRVLARHDERYMPREVSEAIKQRGEWRGET